MFSKKTEAVLKITWYGRCCFLVEHNGKKVLFDPYDTFCNVDIGTIDADILLISSTWHDHGHIGVSPNAHIYSYSGKYENNEIEICGIEAKEDRGTPTVIFNVRMGSYSITNFADFGPLQKEYFDAELTSHERNILNNTNICFARASIKTEDVQETNEHNECFLDYCQPQAIIPEHYFPKSFADENAPQNKKDYFYKPNIIVDEMIGILSGYQLKEVEDCTVELNESDLKEKKIVKFLNIHKQVRYVV